MIYNLLEYLIIGLPTLAFVLNGWQSNTPEDATLVIETGGEVSHYTGRQDLGIQITSRSKDKLIARENIQKVYDLLFNLFGLLLPEVNVGGINYPEIKTYSIVPTQAPGYLGSDDKSYHTYTFNLVITLGYKY